MSLTFGIDLAQSIYKRVQSALVQQAMGQQGSNRVPVVQVTKAQSSAVQKEGILGGIVVTLKPASLAVW